MYRCFIDPGNWPQNEGQLSPEESHHLLNVLRARAGEIIEIFDGRGRTARAELVSGQKKSALIRIVPESTKVVAPPSPSFTLLQAVPKHSRMELVIEKAVELGAQRIIPLITERTVVKIKLVGRGVPAEPSEKERLTQPPSFKNYGGPGRVRPTLGKRSFCCNSDDRSIIPHVFRWRKVALSAAKQCQAAWLTEIHPVVPLAEAVYGLRADLKIFGSLALDTPTLKSVLGTKLRPAIKSIVLAIGPEGDFTEGETKLLLQANFLPVSFGREVLRTETAAIYGLSVLKYEFRVQSGRGRD
jgi:16S rRNA (uracil1498-N3)-methyltransferase